MLAYGRGRWAVSNKRIMIIVIEYSLFQRFRKKTPGVLPMMAYTGRLRPKGVSFSRKMVYKKGKGLDLGAEPPRKDICWVPSPHSPGKKTGKNGWLHKVSVKILLRQHEYRTINLGSEGGAVVRTLANPTNVARVQILASTPYVGWLCYWFSPLLWEVFRLQVLRFSPLLKNQQSQIRSGIHGHI